jgi:hypothetical protein
LAAKSLKLVDEELLALSMLLAKQNRDELLGNRYYKILLNKFYSLKTEEQFELLYELHKKNESIVVGSLAANLAGHSFGQGEIEKAKQLKEWILDNYPDFAEEFSSESIAKRSVVESIDLKKIGVILPLTGDKAKFGNKVLKGLTLALKELGSKYTLVIKDSNNSGSLAAYEAGRLIEIENVALIIGGLYASEAESIFTKANELGATFISLAPIYKEKSFKNSLLVEIPGSVESQINAALDEKTKKVLGRRVALFYPQTELGEAYLSEFWRQAELKRFEVTSVSSFSNNLNDYREPIKNLVGLKFPREREEEFSLWEDIYKTKYKNIDRIQVLKPIVDFDWIFIPSFPQQAVQIIPSFQYLGVKDVAFMGGPSWRSRTMVARQELLGRIFCVGDLEEVKKEKFRNLYKGTYNSEPKLLETYGYESVHLAESMLSGTKIENRSELIESLNQKTTVTSFLSKWTKVDNLWIREMNIGKITSKGVQSI